MPNPPKPNFVEEAAATIPTTITMDIVTIILTAVAVPVIVYFILDFKKRMESSLELTSMDLKEHSENLGKATKAINGDMIKVQTNLLETEKRLFAQFRQIKTEMQNMQLGLDSHIARMEIESNKHEARFKEISSIKDLMISYEKNYRALMETASSNIPDPTDR